MTDQKHSTDTSTDELLSALVDGELSEAEIQQLLDTATPELLERWSRYHLAKEVIDKQTPIHQPMEMLANISAAIDETPKVNTFDESLSALVDGEVTELELRRILKTEDEAALQKLGRYHLVSNILRKEVDLAKSIDVSSAVSAAIANDVVSEEAAPAKPGLWANLGRFGIAASVAGALVVGVQFLSTSEPQNIADNQVAPISGEPILGNQNAVRVVGNGVLGKPSEPVEPTLEEDDSESN